MMAGSPWVKDVSEADFQREVVDRSREVPVVVDFWAAWCGPCRALGPMLERLASETNGAWVLAKVNVDENQELAGAFQVNGIPAVFAVRNGQVVDQFAGLLPEPDLRQFLTRLVPTEADQRIETAARMELADPAGAEKLYRQALGENPTHVGARVGLARLLLQNLGGESEATALLHGIESGEHAPEADRLRRVIAFRDVPHSDADLTSARASVSADPESAVAHYRLGAILAARGLYSEALAELLAAAERDKKLAGTDVRELMVSIFHVIGARSEEADAYRDKLRSLLY